MIIGNHEAQKLLKTVLDFSKPAAQIPHFLLLHGSSHIGKTSIVEKIVREQLGIYTQNDLLMVRDFSEILGKKHTIIVEMNDSAEDVKTLSADHQYQDLGVREINMRLQKSAAKERKILLIENIERMTPEAMNAFLKTCEEPLPKRIIIATTSNISQVIDTIRSRACLIGFQALSIEELQKFAKNQDIAWDNEELQTLLCTMAMGRPGILLKFNELLQKDEEIKIYLYQLLRHLPQGKQRFQSHQSLIKLEAGGLLDPFLDGWIAYATQQGRSDQSHKRLQVKKMMQTNVNREQLLLFWLLE